MGLDPATWAIIGSTIVGAGANIWGANQQSGTNNQNFNAAMQNQDYLRGVAGNLAQPGTNPYSQNIMDFIGRPNGPPGTPYNPFKPSGGSVTPIGMGGQTGSGYSGGGGGGQGENGGNGMTDIANLIPQGMSMMGMPSAAQPASSYTGGGYPNVPGYSGGWTPTYQNAFPGIDPMNSSSRTFADLISSGQITQQQMLQQFGISPQWAADPANADALAAFSNTNFNSSFAANDQQGLQDALGQLPSQPNGGYVNAQGQYVPPTQQAPKYLIGGQYYDNPQGTGNPLGPANTDPTTGQPIGPGVPGWDSTGGGAGGTAGNGMYRYQSPGAFTYNPQMLGPAPTIGSSQQVSAQQIGNPGSVSTSQVSAPTIGNIGQSQSFNSGQDGLMQMMQREFNPQGDSTFSNLNDINSGNTQFDNSDIFKALAPIEQLATDKQVGQLHASAGSLGERFGGTMMQNEAMLRGNIQNNLNLQHAQFAQTSFENAQNRRLQGLGLSAGLNQANNQMRLTGAGQQLSAAQSLGSMGLQGQQLGLQGQIANAGNQLAASQSNASNTLQGGQFNVDALLRAAQANQSTGLQASGMNQQTDLQRLLANQNVLAQFGINNANIANQAGQFNAGQRTNADQFAGQMGQQYNSQILQALGLAGNLQQGQNSYNQGLLGILAGIGVPQAQASQLPGAVGDAAGSMAMLPLLLSMLGGNKGGGGSSYSPYTYAPYGGGYPS